MQESKKSIIFVVSIRKEVKHEYLEFLLVIEKMNFINFVEQKRKHICSIRKGGKMKTLKKLLEDRSIVNIRFKECERILIILKSRDGKKQKSKWVSKIISIEIIPVHQNSTIHKQLKPKKIWQQQNLQQSM